MLFARMVAVALAVAAGTAAVSAARADSGDRAGWSVQTDSRGRAFLVYVATAGGPRLLTLGCLRDVDSFTAIAAGLPGLRASDAEVPLTLRAGTGSWSAAGNVEADGLTGQPAFVADLDVETGGWAKLAARLLPVLRAPGALSLQVGSLSPVQLPLQAPPSQAAIAGPLQKFESVCFGRK